MFGTDLDEVSNVVCSSNPDVSRGLAILIHSNDFRFLRGPLEAIGILTEDRRREQDRLAIQSLSNSRVPRRRGLGQDRCSESTASLLRGPQIQVWDSRGRSSCPRRCDIPRQLWAAHPCSLAVSPSQKERERAVRAAKGNLRSC